MNRKLRLMVTLAALSAAVISFPRSAGAILYEVEIEDFAYVPSRLHINVGDAIEWRNRDLVLHSSTSDNGVWNSGLLARDETFTYTFSTPGTFPYHCSGHPFMRDTIFVSPQTGVDDQSPSTPDRIELSQNYPNPFNAQTAIEYSLPYASHVTITVYNLVGQKISTLVNEDKAAGNHRLVWDAGTAPSGVYFYRIETAGFVQTRKMALAK